MPNRKSLYHRVQLFNTDVAEAIGILTHVLSAARTFTCAPQDLPSAFTKEQVAEALVKLSTTDDDDVVIHLPAAAASAVKKRFLRELKDGHVFLSGAQHFEATTQLPVVPVTQYFLNYILSRGTQETDGPLAELLEAMVEGEIVQSLPLRRASHPRDAQGALIRGGEIIYPAYGKTAGIIVFPRGFEAGLLGAWLGWNGAVTAGLTRATTNRIDNARPNELDDERRKKITDGTTVIKSATRQKKKPRKH